MGHYASNCEFLKEILQSDKVSEILRSDVSGEALEQLGCLMAPPQSVRNDNNRHVFFLTEAIQKEFTVSRFFVCGSYGRRVTIGKPEIDLVVFLVGPDNLPPYTKNNDDHLFRLHRLLLNKMIGSEDRKVLPFNSNPGPNQSPHVSVTINGSLIRVFLAPALSHKAEDQRQATYRQMQHDALNGCQSSIAAWHPALVERPSEQMANSGNCMHAFIRVCRFWVMQHKILSLESYAVETLAYLVAIKLLNGRDSVQGHPRFDQLKAFSMFLDYLADLDSIVSLNEITSPASYISPWSNYCGPVLTDNFNPYYNLLQLVSKRLTGAARNLSVKVKSALRGERQLKVNELFAFHQRSSAKRSFGIALVLAFVVALIAVRMGLYSDVAKLQPITFYLDKLSAFTRKNKVWGGLDMGKVGAYVKRGQNLINLQAAKTKMLNNFIILQAAMQQWAVIICEWVKLFMQYLREQGHKLSGYFMKV